MLLSYRAAMSVVSLKNMLWKWKSDLRLGKFMVFLAANIKWKIWKTKNSLIRSSGQMDNSWCMVLLVKKWAHVNMSVYVSIYNANLPSWELTYRTLEKKNNLQTQMLIGYVSSQEGIWRYMHQSNASCISVLSTTTSSLVRKISVLIHHVVSWRFKHGQPAVDSRDSFRKKRWFESKSWQHLYLTTLRIPTPSKVANLRTRTPARFKPLRVGGVVSTRPRLEQSDWWNGPIFPPK